MLTYIVNRVDKIVAIGCHPQLFEDIHRSPTIHDTDVRYLVIRLAHLFILQT